MKRTIIQKLARLAKEPVFGQPCPEVRWQDVVRIEALGTDAFGAFQIWLTFTYDDGSKTQVAVEMKGYWDIVDSLHERFPSIPADWYDRMAETPWHTEAVLFERDEPEF
jgi:hypothetical protein